MKVGVLSDTHDNVPAVEAAMDRFEAAGVESVVHCGDFIAPPVVPHLDRDGVSVHAVRGNNDGEREGLASAFESLDGGQLHGRFAESASPFQSARSQLIGRQKLARQPVRI